MRRYVCVRMWRHRRHVTMTVSSRPTDAWNVLLTVGTVSSTDDCFDWSIVPLRDNLALSATEEFHSYVDSAIRDSCKSLTCLPSIPRVVSEQPGFEVIGEKHGCSSCAYRYVVNPSCRCGWNSELFLLFIADQSTTVSRNVTVYFPMVLL